MRLPDHWVWDSWPARDDDGTHHLFFLRASRALLDPDRRHNRASIGHARSGDLVEWELLPDALVAADEPAWDDGGHQDRVRGAGRRRHLAAVLHRGFPG